MLDDLINQVAHELTAERPKPDFERRVTARVAEVALFSKRRHRPRTWAPVALAASIAVIAAVVFRGTHHTVVQPRFDAASPGTEPIRLKPEATYALKPEATYALKPEAAYVLKPEATYAAKPKVTSALRPEATGTPGIEPLTEQPINTEPLQLSPLARTEQIDIDPIAIERIDIAAMP